MRLSKRLAVGVLAAVMALSMMTACGGGNPNEKPSSSGSNASSNSSSSASSSGNDNSNASSGNNSNSNSNSSASSGSNSSSSSASSDSKKDDANTVAKPTTWEETWTYKYFKKFDGFPDGFLFDFSIIGEEWTGSEYYVYDRASNRGYMRLYDIAGGYEDTIEEIILYSEPVPGVGYKGYTVYDDGEGGKAAFKGTLQVSEVIKIEPSKSSFSSMEVNDNYELNNVVYHAESILMDYDGKTFSGGTGAHGSGKATFAYCYDKTTGELKYIVTPKETIKVHQLSKTFNKNLVRYEQYEIVEMPTMSNQ